MGEREKFLENTMRSVEHILEIMKNPSGDYICVVCNSEGKETENLETKHDLIKHLLTNHVHFLLGLRLGADITLQQLKEPLIPLVKEFYKQKAMIDLLLYERGLKKRSKKDS